jgi:hypothetical protein
LKKESIQAALAYAADISAMMFSFHWWDKSMSVKIMMEENLPRQAAQILREYGYD